MAEQERRRRAQGGDLGERDIHEDDLAGQHVDAEVGVDAGEDQTHEERRPQKGQQIAEHASALRPLARRLGEGVEHLCPPHHFIAMTSALTLWSMAPMYESAPFTPPTMDASTTALAPASSATRVASFRSFHGSTMITLIRSSFI